jgi:hypothetical protein
MNFFYFSGYKKIQEALNICDTPLICREQTDVLHSERLAEIWPGDSVRNISKKSILLPCGIVLPLNHGSALSLKPAFTLPGSFQSDFSVTKSLTASASRAQ